MTGNQAEAEDEEAEDEDGLSQEGEDGRPTPRRGWRGERHLLQALPIPVPEDSIKKASVLGKIPMRIKEKRTHTRAKETLTPMRAQETLTPMRAG
jgi:hypothetical protein